MKFDFRRIASAAASMVMVGSTVALAAAANYPAPFVQNGSADVAIVYGSNLDLAAVTDVTDSLRSALADQGTSSGGGAPTGGDFVLLAKSSDNVNLGNTVSGVFGTTVNDDDLPTLLADGVYTNDENTDYDYEQKIDIGDEPWKLEYFSDSDYQDKTPTVGINMTSSQRVLNYTLNFLDQPESDVTSSNLVDFETTTLNLFGRDYFVLDAKNGSTQSNSKFTLLDSATSTTVAEGETVTVSAGSTTYDVSISFISTSEVVLNINGEKTNSLGETETYKLNDGSFLGIRDIQARDVAGAVSQVEFSIGSGKLELTGGSAIKLNDDTVNEVTSYITTADAGSSRQKISKIVLEWKNDDRVFITENSELVMPGFEAVKISMGDFVTEDNEITKVVNSGTDSMELRTTLTDGTVTVPLLYANSSGEFVGIGEDTSKLLVTHPGLTNILWNDTQGDRFLVASWNGSDRDPESYILRFTSFTQDTTTAINKTDIQKLVDGAWVNVCTERKTDDTCDVGSLTLTLKAVTQKDSNGGKWVNFTGNAGANFHTLYTKDGLKIYMPLANQSYYDGVASSQKGVINVRSSWHNGQSGSDNSNMSSEATAALRGSGSWVMQFSEEDKDSDINQGNDFNVTLDAQSDGDLEVSQINNAVAPQHKEVDGTVVSEGSDVLGNDDNIVTRRQSDLATLIRRIGSSSAQRYAEITYHDKEAYGEFYLTAADASTGGGGSLGNVAVLDDELASSGMQTKNLVLVGGTCVNSAAATALNVAAGTCGAGWTSATGSGPGSWIIHSLANPWSSAKVATVVAGYEQGDTVNAATAFTTQNIDTTSGKKYTGTTGTSATPVVT